MGTYAPIWGQEACQIGSAYPLQKGDWVFPAFREVGVTLMMGVPLKTFLLYWMGNEIGSRAPEGINDLRNGLVRIQRLFAAAPDDILVAPVWNKTRSEFLLNLDARMEKRGSFQGKEYTRNVPVKN